MKNNTSMEELSVSDEEEVCPHSKLNQDSEENPVPVPCPIAFLNGKVSCSGTCHKNHDLDFEKIKKGVCLFEYAKKDSCRRGHTCWFSHEIPNELRQDASMREKMSRSLQKIQSYRESKELPKLPIKIETNENILQPLVECDKVSNAIDHFLGQIREMLVKKPEFLTQNSRSQSMQS